MTIRWYGLVAPEEAPTGDRRMFGTDTLTYRQFPLPAKFQRVASQGHQGAVTVGSWLGQYKGQGGVWGAGEFLDPAIVPEVPEAIYLIEKKLFGPSVDLDPDLAYEVVPHPSLPDDYAIKVTRATVHAVTFVSTPAFPQVHITVDTEEEMAVLASAGVTIATFAASGVNATAWRKFPLIGQRDTPFDHDTAVDRIAAWSGGDANKFGSAFLWKDPDGNALSRETYRLPVIDIHENKAYLVPRAVFSAGVIMSGGHGGLYDTLNEDDRLRVQDVITDIYDYLRDQYADPRVVAPWQRGGRQGARNEADEPSRVAAVHTEEIPVEPDQMIEDELATITAAGVLKPRSTQFADPKFTKLTPLTIEGDMVFGHLASWKQCHMAVGKKCTLAPRSATNYQYFKQGSVTCSDGSTIRVGKITLGGGHADEKFGLIPAVEHYDNTGTAVAVVNAGEDAFGVWVSGALVASVTEDRVAELRRSPLSGDWRRVNGNLELVAALAVNSPGFPILYDDADGAYSLTAAGMLTPEANSDAVDGFQGKPDTVNFADVDMFIADVAGTERARAINAAFHDLLPPQEGCGCN